jgi:hypothetical protein
MAIWYTYCVVVWYISPRFGIFYQEKAGNPAGQCLSADMRCAKKESGKSRGMVRHLFLPFHLKTLHSVKNSVARWQIFKPKKPFWVNFERSCKGSCWYFYVIFVYFTAE